MFSSLQGYRTYVCAVAGAVVVSAFFAGTLDAQTAEMLLALLGFGGMAALRAAR